MENINQVTKIDWAQSKVDFKWTRDSLDALQLQNIIFDYYQTLSPCKLSRSALQREMYIAGILNHYNSIKVKLFEANTHD